MRGERLMHRPSITIAGRKIGPGCPAYVIAEMSGNHNQSYEQAVKIVQAANDAGADAIKLQTYTADTITLDSDLPWFRVAEGTLWSGQTLHKLYREAYTPWEWQPKLKQVADDLGLHCFSSPFDSTAVDFLEAMDVPAYKVASFELVDVPLIEKIARTGKPIIMSIGTATVGEIDDAVRAARCVGARDVALLKCTSAYPASPEEMNLRTIPHLAEMFAVPSGLSDHSMGIAVPVAAVALGACIIEKHLTISRSEGGPDSAFSLEPHEFRTMVEEIRVAQRALGEVCYEVAEREAIARKYRRSLFVAKDLRQGEQFTLENIRSVRPADGLPPKYLRQILGRRANRELEAGTPLSWEVID
jgi:pseudaminic acid synthase